jgi:signal transduction histidine kinase
MIASHVTDDAPAADGDSEPAATDRGWVRLMCHELRQPLVVAVGYVSMLDDGAFGELPDEARRILGTVAGRLDAMNAIIDRMATGEPLD